MRCATFSTCSPILFRKRLGRSGRRHSAGEWTWSSRNRRWPARPFPQWARPWRRSGCRPAECALTGKQARGRIHPNPARSRQKCFRPGMESGRIVLRTAARSPPLRCQLNQIPGDEAGSDSQMPENLHQQPRRITAGARALFKSLFAALDARIQPRHIFDFVAHSAIQVDQKTDRSLLLAGKPAKKSLSSGPAGSTEQ